MSVRSETVHEPTWFGPCHQHLAAEGRCLVCCFPKTLGTRLSVQMWDVAVLSPAPVCPRPQPILAATQSPCILLPAALGLMRSRFSQGPPGRADRAAASRPHEAWNLAWAQAGCRASALPLLGWLAMAEAAGPGNRAAASGVHRPARQSPPSSRGQAPCWEPWPPRAGLHFPVSLPLG